METEQTLELGRILARLDGCEGGDLLDALCDTAEWATDGHGYAYAEGSLTQEKILEAIRLEIDAHKAMVLGPNPSNYGYTNDDVQHARQAIARLESGG